MTFVKRLHPSLEGCYEDGHYDANAFEDALKYDLEEDDHIFDYRSGVTATKVDVNTATLDNAFQLFFFHNCSGHGAKRKECGKGEHSDKLHSLCDVMSDLTGICIGVTRFLFCYLASREAG